MATTDYTFSFLNNAEALVDDGLSAKMAFAWEAADGSPANGCAEFTITALAAGDPASEKTETATQSASFNSWETLGVPAGGTVTRIEIVELYVRAAGTDPYILHNSVVRLLDNAGAELVSQALASISSYTSWTLLAVGTSAVLSPAQASTEYVRLKLHQECVVSVLATPASADARFDNIKFRITYTDPTIPGVDLAASSIGLHRSYLTGNDICVETSLDAGDTWTCVTVNTNGGNDAIPTLAVDWDDAIHCLYHTSTPTAQHYVSRDHGKTWTLENTFAGLKWARCCFSASRHYLAAYADATANINVYESSDHLDSVATIGTFAASAQLPGLEMDRHGLTRVLYESGGSILQRLITEESTVALAAPTTLVSTRTRIGAVMAAPYGLLLFWNSDDLFADSTAADFATATGSPVSITGTGLTRQFLGCCFDRHGTAWLFGRTAGGTAVLRYSHHFGTASWVAP